MWSTEYVWGVVEGRDQFLKVLCMESPQTRVWLSWNFNAAKDQLLRKELEGNWADLRFSTLTGSMRTQHTSTLRWSWLILLMLLSVTIQGSTGSVTLCTSTESLEDSHLLVRNTEDFVERDTGTTRHVHHEGLPGKGTTLCPFVVTDEYLSVLSVINLLLFSVFSDIKFGCLRIETMDVFCVNFDWNLTL